MATAVDARINPLTLRIHEFSSILKLIFQVGGGGGTGPSGPLPGYPGKLFMILVLNMHVCECYVAMSSWSDKAQNTYY